MNEYNVTSTVVGAIEKLLRQFDVKVSARFKSWDLNIMVPDSISDEVTDYCDKNNITWRML